jgi:outer membrane protein assembly factor BamB
LKKQIVSILILSILISNLVLIPANATIQKTTDVMNLGSSTTQSTTNESSWPMYGHDTQHTGYSASSAPNSFSMLWSTSIYDVVISGPPVISEDRMYFYCIESIYDNNYYVSFYCLNTSNGDIIWTKQIADTDTATGPAASDGKLFVTAERTLFALDMYNGEEIWNKTFTRQIYSHPSVSNNMVFIIYYRNVSALDEDTGNLVWEQSIPDSLVGPPAINDGYVYLNSKGGIYCLDEFSGNIIWHDFVSMHQFQAYPCISEGRIYESYWDTTNDIEFVLAIDISTREEIWETRVIGVPQKITAGYGNIYVGTESYYDGEKTFFYCINGETGEKVWEKDFASPWAIRTLAPVADGKVFVLATHRNILGQTDNTALFVLDAQDGEYMWSVQLGPCTLRDNLAIADGKLFLSTTYVKAYALSEKNTFIDTTVEYDKWNLIKTPDNAKDYIENFELNGCPREDFGSIPVKMKIKNTGNQWAQVNVRTTITGLVVMSILDPTDMRNDMVVFHNFSYTVLVLSSQLVEYGEEVTADLNLPIWYASLIVGDNIELPDPDTNEKIIVSITVSIFAANIELEIFGNFDTVKHKIKDIRGIGDPEDILSDLDAALSQRVQEKMLRALMEEYYRGFLAITPNVRIIPDIPTGEPFSTSIPILPGTTRIVVSLAIPAVGVTLLGLSLLTFGATAPIGAVLIATGLAMIALNNPFPGEALLQLETASPPLNITLEIVQMIPNNVQTKTWSVVADGKTFSVSATGNSTILEETFEFVKSNKEIHFNVTGAANTTGFSYIFIPIELLDGAFTVTIGEDVYNISQPAQNETYSSLYFTYNHSDSTEVRIIGTTVIPEFLPIMFQALFLVLTLIVVSVKIKSSRRKESS